MQLAELSRSIDVTLLGQRIKAARVAAGMTQSDLAAQEVTPAYVSRIEAGQRRPEAKLLERFAERLGVELRILLEDPAGDQSDALRVRLDHAELSLISGDAATARSAVDNLLKDESLRHPTLVRRAKQLRALALEALGHNDEAIRELEALVQHGQPDISWIKAVIALSRCYRESGDYNRAIDVADQAGRLIEDLELAGTTEAIQLTVTLAGAYIQRGDLAHALVLCEQGVAEAEKVGSPIGRASAYWNASVVESMRGNQLPALELAHRAMSLYELGEDSRNLGRLRTEVAFLHLLQSPPDAHAARAALTLADRELAWSAASQLDRADYHLAMGKAELLLGHADDAEQHVSTAIELIGDQSPPLLASCQVVLGQVQADRGDFEAARVRYHQAIATLTSLGIDRDVARLWFDLARLLEEAGDAEGALDAYKRGASATGLVDSTRTAVASPPSR